MGYSCTAKASLTLTAIEALIDLNYKTNGTSNATPDGGFFEIGRENADGAITGTVWKPYDAGRVTRRGSFRIDAEGRVVRFPGVPSALLREAEREGAIQFATRYPSFAAMEIAA